jgi:hypothetical protein
MVRSREDSVLSRVLMVLFSCVCVCVCVGGGASGYVYWHCYMHWTSCVGVAYAARVCHVVTLQSLALYLHWPNCEDVVCAGPPAHLPRQYRSFSENQPHPQ